MKKLGKLSINPEKLIKNEELVNLKGGYGGGDPCTCTCQDLNTYECIGYVFSPTGDCETECKEWICGSLCDHISGTCGNPAFCQ